MEKINPKRKDITGQKFGKLTAVKPLYSNTKNSIVWECICDCGNVFECAISKLTSGNTKSCGCANREPTVETHGLSKQTPLYFVWKELRHRCSNKNHKQYKNYGARGIKVCSEWEDFEVFYDWSVKNGYTEEKLPNGKNKWTIDRIDVNGDYEPSNCRFVTNEVQANNKRNTLYFDYKGKKYNLTELSNAFGVERMLLYNRIHTRNWDLERAITTPKRSW